MNIFHKIDTFKHKIFNHDTRFLLNSTFNAGRSLINPLFIAIVSYLFIRQHSESELQEINKTTAIFNLLLLFSGWGLRDFLVKESVKRYSEFNETWHLAFYSKLILIVPLSVLSLLFLDSSLLLVLLVVFVFRTFNTLYEPLIITYKKGQLFFIVDFIVAFSLAGLVATNIVATANYFFYFLSAFEILKLITYRTVFKTPNSFKFNYRELLQFLKITRFYFFLVLVSFFQSKADLYLLGFLLNPQKLNEYQLLSSLISLAQILTTAFVVSYSKLLYRNIRDSKRSFKIIVLKCGFLAAILFSPCIYLILKFIYHFNYNWYDMVIVAINIMCFAYVLYEMFCYTKKEQLKKVLLYVTCAGLINFAFSFLLISRFGTSGALAGNTAGLMLLGSMMWYGRINESKQQSI